MFPVHVAPTVHVVWCIPVHLVCRMLHALVLWCVMHGWVTVVSVVVLVVVVMTMSTYVW